MEHKIINTGDYLLIVDDSEIKKETYCYDSINNILVFYKGSMKNIGFQKVISHLPLNNSPILEGVILLPPLEDDVEKIAKQEAEKFHNKIKHDDWDIYNQLVYEDTEMIKIGYNKAKEKYKYTEEDMIECWKYASIDKNQIFGDQIGNSYMSFIQSLQQPKIPVAFECEIQHYYHTIYYHDVSFVQCTKEQYDSIKKEIPSCPLKKEIKTTTNSQGLTQWVGTYSFDDKN